MNISLFLCLSFGNVEPSKFKYCASEVRGCKTL